MSAGNTPIDAQNFHPGRPVLRRVSKFASATGFVVCRPKREQDTTSTPAGQHIQRRNSAHFTSRRLSCPV